MYILSQFLSTGIVSLFLLENSTLLLQLLIPPNTFDKTFEVLDVVTWAAPTSLLLLCAMNNGR